MGFKQRLAGVPVLGTALRMQERYVEDAADSHAASIGFFGFLSLFPLLALAVAAAGFVFRGDPGAMDEVATAVQEAIPALSATLGDGESGVAEALASARDNAGSIGLIGLVLLLVSGLRVVAGAQRASAVIFRVELPTGLGARVEQLVALAVLGLLALGGAALGGAIGVDAGSVDAALRSVLISAGTFGIDLLLFVTSYKLLTPGDGPSLRVVLPGAVLAALGWAALKLFGTSYIASQGDNPAYAGVGGVIGLLVLLYLAGRLYCYGAELSAIRAGIDVPEIGPAEEPEVEPRPAHDVAPSTGSALGFLVTGVGVGLLQRLLAGTLRDDDPDHDE